MKTNKTGRETTLVEKTDILIAIGAATAANCIPCFEHLYEKAVTSGITAAEIKRASEIAGLVKNGAHAAISNSIDELLGSQEAVGLTCSIRMHYCESCKFKGKYDKHPESLLGRIWKWHIGWCPGWKSYLKSLPDERRTAVIEKYNKAPAP